MSRATSLTSAAPARAAPAAAQDRWPDATVLVVDDEAGLRHFLVKTLSARAGQVLEAGSAEEAQGLLARHRFDLLILDITLPGKSGIELLEQLRDEGHPGEVILITAFADLETAIAALRAGAGDFLLKPFRVTQVLNAVRQGLERARLKRENWLLKRALSQRTPPADGLVGRSIVIKGLQAALQRVAAVDSTVLLTGESGTGKELAALALHRLGARSGEPAGPFVPLNCAAASRQALEVELFGQPGHDGLVVHARGGTLFLDEVAELPLPLQAALLRVIEHRCVRPVGSEQEIPIDVRVVAATSRPLRAEVDAGRFRPELFYRLQVVEITLPPLRAHKEDIPDLVAHFVGTLAPRLGVPPIEVTEAELQFLQQYDWPGNVRELRNLIERSLIVGGLNVSALYQELSRQAGGAGAPPAAPPPPPGAREAGAEPVGLAAIEKRHILAVLESVGGDKTRAAHLLGISRRTLERRFADWSGAPA